MGQEVVVHADGERALPRCFVEEAARVDDRVREARRGEVALGRLIRREGG